MSQNQRNASPEDESGPAVQLPSPARLEAMHALIHEAYALAIGFTSQIAVQEKARKFLSLVDADVVRAGDDSALALRFVDAHAYAVDLALFTPSLTGKTAIDRLLRDAKAQAPGIAEAAALLRASRFRLVRIARPLGEGLFEAEDIASGSSLTLCALSIDPAERGSRWVMRTCAYEGVQITVEAVTPLDDGMLEAARPFMEQGRDIKNPLRCAEALYRHAMRFCDPLPPPGMDAGEDEFPYGAADGPLHALAEQWAQDEALPEPDAQALDAIRSAACRENAFNMLHACHTAREMELKRLALAYDRILVILLETIHRRNAMGIHTAHTTLDALAAEIRHESTIPRDAAALFDEVCRRARLSGTRKPASQADRTELDKVLARIQALRSKTVEQGCTEEEALLAAGKVADLLDQHGLSLSEIAMKEQSCAGEGIETPRRRRAPLDDCVPAVAAFCDCRSWYELSAQGHIRHVFFGLPADVAGARYLYERMEAAFDTETRNFKRGPLYERYDSGQRRSATQSFQLGLKHGICQKLKRLKQARAAHRCATNGRDLVPFKNAVIEEELSGLGLNLRAIERNSSRNIIPQAFHTGLISGEHFEMYEPIEEATS